MKKILLAILLLGSTYCYSQKKHIFLGIRAGVNTSVVVEEINPEGFTIVGRHTGYHIGPTIHIEPTRFFGLNSGLLLNTTGWVNKTERLADTLLYREDIFKNIQVPLTASIKIGIAEFARIIIEAGGYLNFSLSGYSNIKEVTGEIHEETIAWYQFSESDDTNDITYKRTNAGAVFGCAFQHKFITLGTCYNLGMVDITKNEYVLHNHIWNFYVTLRSWKRK
ncbi:MAG: outer membrane beta-barrel protein [Bacteroidales bacterium]